MHPCKDCIVDMICIKSCPIFEIDLQRLQTDEEVYLKRCMNNIEDKTYKISRNIHVEVSFTFIRWFKNGNIHRYNDKPAIIDYNGCKYWYKNGNRHRGNDQPAVIFSTGIRHWYKNGVYHRVNNKPAVIWADGTSHYYKNGIRYDPM